LRPATSGNKKSEKSKVATAPKNKKKKPKEAVKPEESSSRGFAKDSAKFPEKVIIFSILSIVFTTLK
jgi:hypothetical protein